MPSNNGPSECEDTCDKEPSREYDLSGMPTYDGKLENPLESDPGDSVDFDSRLSLSPDLRICAMKLETTCDDSVDNDGDGSVDCDDAFMGYPEIADNVLARTDQCIQLEPKCSPLPEGGNCSTGLSNPVEPKSPTDEEEPACRPDDDDDDKEK